MHERQYLEERAHFGAVDQAMHASLEAHAGFGRRLRLQLPQSGFDAECAQELALRHRTADARTGAARRRGEGLEVDVRREVGATRRVQHWMIPVLPNGLEGVAADARGVAVIDEERGAAVPGQAPR